MLHILHIIEGVILGVSLVFLIGIVLCSSAVYARYSLPEITDKTLTYTLYFSIVLGYIVSRMNADFVTSLRVIPTLYLASIVCISISISVTYILFFYLYSPSKAFIKTFLPVLYGVITVFILYYKCNVS